MLICAFNNINGFLILLYLHFNKQKVCTYILPLKILIWWQRIKFMEFSIKFNQKTIRHEREKN